MLNEKLYITLESGPLNLQIRIDRIDTIENNKFLIDYEINSEIPQMADVAIVWNTFSSRFTALLQHIMWKK